MQGGWGEVSYAESRPSVAAFRPFAAKPMTGRWDGVAAALLAAGFAALCGCSGASAREPPRNALSCDGEVVGHGTFGRAGAGRVIDGRTFTLDDGREVRLAAIEVPAGTPGRNATQDATQDAIRDATPAGAAAAAADALGGLLAGSEIVLRQAEPQKTDRYGRLVAYVFTQRDGIERPVQAELIGLGAARVAAHAGSHACAMELLAREAAARAAKLGLWAISYYDTLDAENPAGVLAEQGRFALVEGKVVSVRESGATIYVNFGRRWSEDFTVTISKRNARSFTAAGLEPAKLAGRHIRVRGWIEERGGPWIEAARPEQIELTDGE